MGKPCYDRDKRIRNKMFFMSIPTKSMCCQTSRGGLRFFQFGQSTPVPLPKHKPAIFGMLATTSRNNESPYKRCRRTGSICNIRIPVKKGFKEGSNEKPIDRLCSELFRNDLPWFLGFQPRSRTSCLRRPQSLTQASIRFHTASWQVREDNQRTVDFSKNLRNVQSYE